MLDPSLQSPSTINLRRLVIVRLAVVGLALPALAVVGLWLGLPLPVLPLFGVIVATILVTLAGAWWSTRSSSASDGRGIALQLGIDVAALTAVLYLSGGWTNPLVSLYLVPVAVAAATLSAAATWGWALLCVLAYSLVTRFYVPVLHVHGAGDTAFTLHVTGMWMTFVVAAALVAYFGSSMAATLRARESALRSARERNLKNEQILGVATLAAGTAHELSTPLASINVIAAELESQTEGDIRDELRLLLGQIDVCREVLDRLRDAATPARETIRADQLLESLLDRFSLLRPTTSTRLEMGGAEEAPWLEIDTTLRQALLNLLDNAADVSPADISLAGRWMPGGVEIDVLDRGPGFGGVAGAEGNGMGMGFLLANTSIEGAGGSVHALQREGGGTCVRVRLPVAEPSAAVQ